MIEGKALGQRLRGWRLVRGLDVAVLSEQTGIPSGTIGAYETGKRVPGGRRLLEIMFALDLSARDLIDR